MRTAIRIVVAALAVTVWTGAAFARPVVPAEKRYWDYSGNLPACDNPDVISKITGRFHDTETEYWNSDLAILGVDQIKVTALRPWGLDHIPRNFCQAKAQLSDHTTHELFYSVAEDQGFIGADFGVEFCLTGLDREFAYAPNCKMQTP